MAIPRWDDPSLKAGTMVRTALWLVSEVGVGNVFTKDQHRQAFAGVTQADRRLRDLRKFGWVIHTNLQDATLKTNEQRLVVVGAPLWEPGVDRSSGGAQLTAKERRLIFADHDYQCNICGIGGGENYPDAPQKSAVLTIVRSPVIDHQGAEVTNFSVQCQRCQAGDPKRLLDVGKILDALRSLDKTDIAVFVHWAENGRRSNLDRLWAEFRQLPRAIQEQLAAKVRDS